MTKIDDIIDVALPHLQDDVDKGTVEFYRETIKVMMKSYANEVIEDVFQNLDKYILSIQPHWAEVQKLKQKIENE